MLLYLSEYKLAEYLNDKDIGPLAKILLCLFAAFAIASILIKSVQTFPSNLMWLALFLSFIPLLLKNSKNFKSIMAHLTYFVFPIAIKAYILNVVIVLINSGLAIAYVTYAPTSKGLSVDSMMGGMLSDTEKEPTPSNADAFMALGGETIAIISSLIAIAVTIIFIRWRYHECLKIMSKYNV